MIMESIKAPFLLEVNMDLLNTVQSLIKMGVIAWGAWLAGQGAMTWSEGHGAQSTAKKDEGGGKILGGIVIIAIGAMLIPKIFEYFAISGI